MRLQPLLNLWRKAFPIRYVLVIQYKETNIPPAIGDDGDALGFDDLLPELVDAYRTCAPMFTWLVREIARMEKQYHAPAPHEPQALAVWRSAHEALNNRIAALNRAVRAPLIANLRARQLKELAEKKAATDAESKALEEFFTE
ncbi:MAG: hypothetical protein ABIY63_13395 [Fibrobacteria bacterium]